MSVTSTFAHWATTSLATCANRTLRGRRWMPSGTRGVIQHVTRGALLAATWLCLFPAEVFGQYFSPELLPNELSFAMGAVRDQSPSQWSPSVVVAISWDWNEQDWGVLVVEGEIGSFSEAESCRRSPDDLPDNCFDAAVAGGLRLRSPPRAWSGASYFGSVLLGEYWKGSGTNAELEYSSSHFAMQAGGGVEFRWPGSIQGVRVSVDYRHVFAGDRDRNQLRLLGAYIVGPRRFKGRPTG
jgi:hypothetical protein